MNRDPDVVVVGASIAGTTAAVLLARAGHRVVVLEKHTDPGRHKVLCTHTLQPCAMPVVDRLGLREPLLAAGAVPHLSNWWTRWGWIVPRDAEGEEPLPHGLNIRRATLDPLLRRFAAAEPGVEVRYGQTVTGLVEQDGRVVGVRVRSGGHESELRAPLVVGADGRHSAVGAHSGLPVRRTENSRFGYWAYFRGLPTGGDAPTRIWFMDPDGAYCIPNDDGLTLVAATPVKDGHLEAFRDDLPGAFRAYLRALPDAPAFDEAAQVSPIIGSTDLPLIDREPARPGLALVGDAALTTDPVWGIGCAWAMQSGARLADAVGAQGERDLDAALLDYRDRHEAGVRDHQTLFEDFASGRPFSDGERLMFAGAARDDVTARHLYRFGSRLITVADFLDPVATARAAAVVGMVPA